MKMCSIMFTIGWSMALVFGWLAIAAPARETETMLVLNVSLAAIGAALGMWSWLRIRSVMADRGL